MCPLLGLIFSLLTIVRINFLLHFVILFFIIAIILFGSNYLLLLEGMAAHSVPVGVFISSPLAPGLDCQVSGMACCVPSPTWMLKSSSDGTWIASPQAIIGHNFPIIAIIVLFWVAACINLRPADHWKMIMRYKAHIGNAGGAYGDRKRAVIVLILALLF